MRKSAKRKDKRKYHESIGLIRVQIKRPKP